MKHFIIELIYTSTIEKIDEALKEHREFLQIGYEKNMLLFSGPMNPRIGGIIIAKAKSEEEVKEFFINDPYNINLLADYKITEFIPVKYQSSLKEWIDE